MSSKVTPYRKRVYSNCMISDSRSGTVFYKTGSDVLVGPDDNRKTGTSVANWRDRIAKGIDASSPYSWTGVHSASPANVWGESETLPGGITAGYRITSTSASAIYGSVPSVDMTNAEARNRALASVYRQLRNSSGQARALAPLAEAKELSRLVNQAVLYSTEFAQACLHARKTRGKSVYRYMQNYWLAFNFGLRPMIKDIDEIGKSIANYISRENHTCHVDGRGSFSRVGDFKSLLLPDYAPFGCVTKAKGRFHLKVSYRITGAYSLRLSSSDDYGAFEHLGVGWSDIPAAAWELTAFSWMFDYFVNVGEVLDTTFYAPPGACTYLVENRKAELTFGSEYELQIAPGNPNNIRLKPGPVVPSQVTYVEFNRTPMALLPHASFVVRSFDSAGQHGISKLLNLLAVLKHR